MINDRNVSLYANAREIGTPDNSNTIIDCLESIQGDFKDIVEPVRNSPNYSQAKATLPAITWCGTFNNGRDLNSLSHYNNLICLDIDQVENPELIKSELKNETWIQSIFVSPSNKGLKVIVPFEDNSNISNWNEQLSTDKRAEALINLKQYHSNQFNDLENVFKTKYDIDLDPSGKDIPRLCFVSYDQNAYISPSPTAYPVAPTVTATATASPITSDCPTATGKPATAPANGQSEPLKENACDDWTLAQTAWHLKIIPADDYQTWINVGFALHGHYQGSEAAFKVFAEWSQKSPKFISSDDCRKNVWNQASTAKDAITLRSIAKLHNAECDKFYGDIDRDMESRNHPLYSLFVSKTDTMYFSKLRDGYKARALTPMIEDINVYLFSLGITPRKNNINSIIRNLYMVRDTYNTVSCLTGGVHTFNGISYLIEKSPRMIMPIKGNWDNLKFMLEKTLPTKDREWLYSRLALDIKAFLNRDMSSKGQLIMFIGEPRTGKTTLQRLIKDLYAGTTAEVSGYITGVKTFNKEMLTSPYWVVDDTFQRPVGVQVPLFKEKLIDFIKKASVVSPISFSTKFKDDVIINDIFRRGIFTLNDRNEILSLLPEASDIEDKYALLSFEYTFTGAGFDENIYDQELPHFAHYLLNEFVKPEWVAIEPRFGIVTYHNEALRRKIFNASEEAAIYCEIETILKEAEIKEIIGTGKDIFDMLHNYIQDYKLENRMRNGRFIRLEKSNFGHVLKKLKQYYPDTIKNDLPMKNGINQWKIIPTTFFE